MSSVANPPSSSNATGLRRSRRLWCRPPVLTSDRRVFSSGGASVRRLDVSAPPGPSQYEGPPRDGCLLNPEHTRGSVHRPDPCAAFCRCSSWLISLGTDWCRWLRGVNSNHTHRLSRRPFAVSRMGELPSPANQLHANHTIGAGCGSPAGQSLA